MSFIFVFYACIFKYYVWYDDQENNDIGIEYAFYVFLWFVYSICFFLICKKINGFTVYTLFECDMVNGYVRDAWFLQNVWLFFSFDLWCVVDLRLKFVYFWVELLDF